MTGITAATTVGIRYQCLLLEKPKNHTALGTKLSYIDIKKLNGELFEDWVRELDRIFSPEGKSVTLAIDNCPAHARIENLKSNCFS